MQAGFRQVVPDRIVLSEGFTTESLAGVEPLREIGHRRVTLLLGEPGIGKSTALEELHQQFRQEGRHAAFVDLRKVHSEVALTSLFESFLTGSPNPNPVLLLDSLDETQVVVSRFVQFLETWLTKFQSAGWSIVATCRTAEAVRALQRLFERLGPDPLRTLCPLSRDAAALIIRDRGIDDVALLAEVGEKSLESLAAIPFTLTLLCRNFAADGTLGPTKRDVFDRAISLMLADEEVEGYTPLQLVHLPPLRKRSVAELMAGFVLFTDAAGVGVYEPGLVGGGLQTEQLAKASRSDDGPTPTNDEYQLLLRTPLFAHSGVQQRQFAHRSLRDYLAAHQLAKWRLPESQLRSIMTTQAGGLSSVPPQLLEVAGWYVAIAEPTPYWLVDADPLSLALGITRGASPEIARHITDRLLLDAANVAQRWRWQDSPVGLGHSELADQLRPSLAVPGDANLVALYVLRGSYVEGLEDDLLLIVQSSTFDIRARMMALEMLNSHAPCRIADVLITPAFWVGDDRLDLRGVVIQAFSKSGRRADEIIELLVEPPEDYFGLYQHALFELERELDEELASAVLGWWLHEFEGLGRRGARPNRTLSHLGTAAVRFLAERGLHASLVARALVEGLNQHLEKVPFEVVDLPTPYRWEVLEAVIESPSLEYWWGVLRLRDSNETPLLGPEDFPWTALRTIHEMKATQGPWLLLSRQLLRVGDLDNFAIAWLYRDRPLWDSIRNWFDAIDLKSDEAERLRAEYLSAREADNPGPGMSESDYVDTIERIIVDVEREPGKFWHLARWLDVDLSTSRYRSSFSTGLLGESAELLSGAQLERIKLLARSYIALPVPGLPTRYKRGTHTQAELSGYRALHFLYEEDRQWLVKHASRIEWGRYFDAIVEFPLAYNQDEVEHLTRQGLLALVKSHCPDAFKLGLRRYVLRRGNPEALGTAATDLAIVAGPEAAESFRRWISSVDASHMSSFVDALFAASPKAGADWAEHMISNSAEPSTVSMALVRLLSIDEVAQGDRLLNFIRTRPDLAREVLPQVATMDKYSGVPLAFSDESETLAIYIAVRELFPPEEEAFPTGVHAVSPREQLAQWRDRLLSRVVNAGTARAVVEVTQLARDRPEFDLDPYVVAARESFRLNGWSPLTIDELCALVVSSRNRVIRSVDQLLHVVCEELDVAQQWLRGETPQAFSLWDITTGYCGPKSEERFSDWYAHALRIRLVESGTIVNREVEVRSSGVGVGERNDIRIEVSNPGDAESFVVIVEVKGVWNAGLLAAMETQLADRYLGKAGLTHGVYLVALCDPNRFTDKAKGRAALRNGPGLEAALQAQAASLAPRFQIAPVLHDANPPWPASGN